MPALPTYQSQSNPETPINPPRAPSIQGNESTILGGALSQVGEDIARAGEMQGRHAEHLHELALHQQNVIGHLEQEKLRQVKALEVNRMYSQLRTDWTKRLIEYQENPGDPNLLKNATGEYDDYVKGMLKNSKWDDTRNELSLHAADFKLNFVNDVYRLQSHQQLQEFGATYDKMLSNADDSIFATKSITELSAQKDLLNKTIDDAVATKQIKDPETIQNLRDKANLLGVSWAESMLPINPEAVKTAIDKGVLDGVSSQHKYILMEKADEVIKTKVNQEGVLLHDALQSDITQRQITGEGNSLNLDRYEQRFGTPARQKAERELAMASNLHQYVELAKGASMDTLQKLSDKSTPSGSPDSPLFGEQMHFHTQVQQLINMALADRKADPFSYFSQNTVALPLVSNLQQNDTPENRKKLQETVLELQKADKTIMPYEYAIMPKAEAERFANNFNQLVAVGSKGDGSGVRDQLLQFSSTYKDHLPIAINQLNSVKQGDQVTPKINPLLWHLNNPSLFRLVVDAIRKDPSEELKRLGEEKQIKNFLADVSSDKSFMSYQASMLSANNGEEASKLVRGVKETFTDFARDYVANGGKLKDASSLFFGPYSFGKVNGAVFARPMMLTDSTGKPHILSSHDISMSNNYMEWYPTNLDPKTIDPKSILNETAHFTEDQLNSDIATALRSNSFWSTTEDETGAYLFTKGTLFGAPRQVFTKSGIPVRANFMDSVAGVPPPNFTELPGNRPFHGAY